MSGATMSINVANWWRLDDDGVLRIATPEGFDQEFDFNYELTVCASAFSPQMMGNFAALQRRLQDTEAARKEVEVFVRAFFDEGTWKLEPAWTLEHELAEILRSTTPLTTEAICHKIDAAIRRRRSSQRPILR